MTRRADKRRLADATPAYLFDCEAYVWANSLNLPGWYGSNVVQEGVKKGMKGRGERPAGRAELLTKGGIWAHAASAGIGTGPEYGVKAP